MQHEVTEHVLDGGAKGLVVNVPGTRVTSLVIRFNSGYQFADPGMYELPHVLEHLLVAGAKTHYPRHQAFSVELQKNGAYINATTGAAANGYIAEFANFELDRFLELQREYFLEQLFDDKGVAAEVGNVRQELTRNTTQPGSVCGIHYAAAAYPGRFQTYEERIRHLPRITAQACGEYYRQSHTWGNLRFYLAGDFADGGKGTVLRLQEALKDLPAGKRRQPDLSPGRNFVPLAVERDIDQLYYQAGWFTPALPERLWAPAVVLRSLMGEGMGSRIYGKVRERGLAYHIDCSVDFDPGSAALEFGGFVTRDNLEPLFGLVAGEMETIRQGKVTEAEVAAAKNLRSGSQLRAYQTAGQLLNWYMAHYEEREVIEDFDGWIKRLLAVSAEQVVEAARHLTSRTGWGLTMVGKISQAEAQQYAQLLDSVAPTTI